MTLRVYFFVSETLMLFCIAKVISAAEPDNPCSNGLDNTVADMCTNDSAIEDSVDGSKAVDSVTLRITKQQNNCICHVSLHNNATNYTIYMSKYDGLSKAAPEQVNCGLAVDVELVDTSETTLQSIECTSGTSLRSISLGGSELKFKSRIINGDLTRGYCMQISRDQAIYNCSMVDKKGTSGSDDDWIQTSGEQHTSLDECKKYCLLTETCVAVHYQPTYCFVYNRRTALYHKDDSIYSGKQCVDTQKLKIRCYSPESTQTDQETTTEETFTTKLVTVTKPISDNFVTNSNTQSTIKEKQQNIKDTSPSFLVALVIAIIGCTVAVIFAGTTVYYKRQLLTQKSKSKSSLESSVNYVDLSVARDVSDYSAINTQVGNEQYETVNERK